MEASWYLSLVSPGQPKPTPSPFKVCCAESHWNAFAVPLLLSVFSSFLAVRYHPSPGFRPPVSGAEIASFSYYSDLITLIPI